MVSLRYFLPAVTIPILVQAVEGTDEVHGRLKKSMLESGVSYLRAHTSTSMSSSSSSSDDRKCDELEFNGQNCISNIDQLLSSLASAQSPQSLSLCGDVLYGEIFIHPATNIICFYRNEMKNVVPVQPPTMANAERDRTILPSSESSDRPSASASSEIEIGTSTLRIPSVPVDQSVPQAIDSTPEPIDSTPEPIETHPSDTIPGLATTMNSTKATVAAPAAQAVSLSNVVSEAPTQSRGPSLRSSMPSSIPPVSSEISANKKIIPKPSISNVATVWSRNATHLNPNHTVWQHVVSDDATSIHGFNTSDGQAPHPVRTGSEKDTSAFPHGITIATRKPVIPSPSSSPLASDYNSHGKEDLKRSATPSSFPTVAPDDTEVINILREKTQPPSNLLSGRNATSSDEQETRVSPRPSPFLFAQKSPRNIARNRTETTVIPLVRTDPPRLVSNATTVSGPVENMTVGNRPTESHTNQSVTLWSTNERIEGDVSSGPTMSPSFKSTGNPNGREVSKQPTEPVSLTSAELLEPSAYTPATTATATGHVTGQSRIFSPPPSEHDSLTSAVNEEGSQYPSSFPSQTITTVLLSPAVFSSKMTFPPEHKPSQHPSVSLVASTASEIAGASEKPSLAPSALSAAPSTTTDRKSDTRAPNAGKSSGPKTMLQSLVPSDTPSGTAAVSVQQSIFAESQIPSSIPTRPEVALTSLPSEYSTFHPTKVVENAENADDITPTGACVDSYQSLVIAVDGGNTEDPVILCPGVIEFGNNRECGTGVLRQGAIPIRHKSMKILCGGLAGECILEGNKQKKNVPVACRSGRSFEINGASSVSFEGITWRYFHVDGEGTENRKGGAIIATGGSAEDLVLKFLNCRFEHNSAKDGGAVYIVLGTTSFIGCSFLLNEARAGSEKGGGAIYIGGGASTVIDCSFRENHSSLWGGAIAFEGHDKLSAGHTIRNSVFITNSCAQAGGALHARSAGSITISGNEFSSNFAFGVRTTGIPAAGAGSFVYSDPNTQTVCIRNNYVAENTPIFECSGFYFAALGCTAVDEFVCG